MWPFTKKYSIEESGLMKGLTDYHSHVLPGVDDGIKRLEETANVIEKYESLGVGTLWLTPHIMEDVPNTPADLRSRFEALTKGYTGALKLRLAAENMLDNLFDNRLAENDVLPIGEKGDHLLVETSYFTPPTDFDEKLSRTFNSGYLPILAHPERYVYMDTDDYESLHERGIKFQLNISSIFGFYGNDARKKAEYILKRGYYNAIGSDTHRCSQMYTWVECGTLTSKQIDKLLEIPGID